MPSVCPKRYLSSTSAGAIVGSLSPPDLMTRGQLHPLGLPAAMHKLAREWRLAADLADETILVGRVSGGDGLQPIPHSLRAPDECEVLPQDGFASFVHDAGGRADLRVAVGGQVVHQEIDEPAFLLKRREKTSRPPRRLDWQGPRPAAASPLRQRRAWVRLCACDRAGSPGAAGQRRPTTPARDKRDRRSPREPASALSARQGRLLQLSRRLLIARISLFRS